MVGLFSRPLIGFGLVAALALALPMKSAYAVGENGETATNDAADASVKYTPERAAVTVKRYFVEFRGRAAASYGHLYILFGELNGRGEVIKSNIAGLYPAGDRQNCDNCSLANWMIGHVIFVPSGTTVTDGDLEEKYVTARYRVMLDKVQYAKLTAYVAKFQANPPLWNALVRNCVSFGKEIGELLGLKTPPFIWLKPEDFVNTMREMNGVHKEQAPLKDAATISEMPETKAIAHRTHSNRVATTNKPVTAENKSPVANANATSR